MLHIFISYSKQNRDYARGLADHLIAKGFDIWIDDRIDYGEEWWEVITDAITNCAAFIVIMTPESRESKWVKRELQIADHEGKPLFPLLLDGENWPIFYGTQYVDVKNGSLPLPGFCDQLAELAPRQVQAGTDMIKAVSPPEPIFTLPMLEWVEIPAGWVTIEGKEHYVEAFRISRYLVTYAQFQAFLDAPDGFRNNAWWQGLSAGEDDRSAPGKQAWPIDNHPREHVSWYDAVVFSRWLSEKMGFAISLPTEQQWQRAAQGDDGREYPWGNEFDSSRCNTHTNCTTPIDRYPNGVSPYGVYDMAGNVWEWCLNEYENPKNTERPVRILRGGSWLEDQYAARCAYRDRRFSNYRGFNLGFRVVCVPSLRQATLASDGELPRLKERTETLLAELPRIRSLYLDHPESTAWRETARRYLREFDGAFPNNDYLGRFDNISWHPPNKPADDTEAQEAIYKRACDGVEGLLRAALRGLEEKNY